MRPHKECVDNTYICCLTCHGIGEIYHYRAQGCFGQTVDAISICKTCQGSMYEPIPVIELLTIEEANAISNLYHR